MPVTTLELELPEELSRDDARMMLAVKLYEVGRATLGDASAIAGISKVAFMELLGRYGAPIFNYSPEDLRAEVGD